MNKRPHSQLKSLNVLQQMSILCVCLCWSMASIAQTMSDLLILIAEDGTSYTAQQTLFADDDLIVIKLPEGRKTLNTVFSGSGSALYRRAHEKDPDKLTLVSGSVFTRFTHQFNELADSVNNPGNSEASDATQRRASMAQFDTTMASAESLTFRVSWVLPPNIELLEFNATHTRQNVDSGNWTQQRNAITYEQIGGSPTQLTIDYLVHEDKESRQTACLASVGPSEWCSPDVDTDRVPDYRDLCISAALEINQNDPLDGDAITLSDTPVSGRITNPLIGSTPHLIPDESLGCAEDKLIVLPGIQFESGQTYLNAQARSSLAKVAVALQRMPNRLFQIAAHTDNAGYVNNNQLLSENRADAIRHYLMLRGVGPNQIQARGHGETSPAHDNRTAAGRRANRRVELRQLN